MIKKRDLEFLFEVGAFRYILRTWRQFLNADFQNNAEHSFRVALLALLIAKHEKVKDTEKVLKMALIHDLGESRTGDVNYLSRQYTDRNEKMAIADVFQETVLEEMVDVWDEFEKKQSAEAQIVKDADNLDVELELKEQEARGFNLRRIWRDDSKHKLKRNLLFTKTAREIWDKIEDANVHDWHLRSRNRFNGGDWKDIAKGK